MSPRYSYEFRRNEVRIATTNGLTRPQIASDLGVRVSTLNNWVQQHQNDDLMSGPHEDVEKKTRTCAKRTAFSKRKGRF